MSNIRVCWDVTGQRNHYSFISPPPGAKACGDSKSKRSPLEQTPIGSLSPAMIEGKLTPTTIAAVTKTQSIDSASR